MRVPSPTEISRSSRQARVHNVFLASAADPSVAGEWIPPADRSTRGTRQLHQSRAQGSRFRAGSIFRGRMKAGSVLSHHRSSLPSETAPGGRKEEKSWCKEGAFRLAGSLLSLKFEWLANQIEPTPRPSRARSRQGPRAGSWLSKLRAQGSHNPHWARGASGLAQGVGCLSAFSTSAGLLQVLSRPGTAHLRWRLSDIHFQFTSLPLSRLVSRLSSPSARTG